MLENRAKAIWAERQSRLENARASTKQNLITLVETQESVATEADECENYCESSDDMEAWRHDPNASKVSSTYEADTMTPRLPDRYGLECEKTIRF